MCNSYEREEFTKETVGDKTKTARVKVEKKYQEEPVVKSIQYVPQPEPKQVIVEEETTTTTVE